jgi:glutamine amidotransferase
MGKGKHNIAIVDYGLGNLFSIRHALEFVDLDAEVTSSIGFIAEADAVILPGVGAFGDAMNALTRLELVKPIQDAADNGKLLVGICLVMQFLFSESHEFGVHKGLDIIKGNVVRFKNHSENFDRFKVPQVGWNRVYETDNFVSEFDENAPVSSWENSLLEGLPNGAFMYFVHSYFTVPEDDSVTLGRTVYANTEFCSAIMKENVYAFQFHPERSGINGLKVYQNINKKLMT